MDTDERRRICMVYVIAIEITGLLFTSCAATPQFDSQPQFHKALENNGTAIGALLFTLSANDSDSPFNEMTIFSDDPITTLYVNITQGSKTSPTTANVTLKKELDRESDEGGIELKFSLSDTKGNLIHKSVRLFILDVCDEKPVFQKPTYTLEIEEINTTESGLVFTEIRADDRDNGAIITYRMEPKTESEYWMVIYNETFEIKPTNGGLYLLKNLDYENNSFYQFTLHAQDQCGLTAVPANLTIRVKDVQDKPPFFIGLPYMRIIPEGIYNNSPILRVQAFDGDLGIPNRIKYSMNNTIKCSDDDAGCVLCKSLFTINSSTGDITVTGNLDWEMKGVLDIYGTCNIEVEAEEMQPPNVTQSGYIKSKTNIAVTIQDENNHSPRFANTSYTATIQENANANTPILLDGDATGIEVSDKDQGSNSKFSVTLKCLNAEDCETFAVVPSMHIFSKGTLTIRVNNSLLLDYEERQNMTITVIATEDNNSSHTDTATVMVRIENVNEFSPAFEKETYEERIEEDSENGTQVINITATDNDTESYGRVTYSLSGGSNLFSVNNETGQVLTNCQPWQLDREQILKIYLTIIAKDGGGRMNQAQIIVDLDDKNDNPPVFQQEIYTAFLEENSTKYTNTTLLTVKATDADQNGTKNSEVSYTIGNTTWNSNFAIDNITGEIRLESELDYEALNDTFDGVINLTVFAFDKGTPAKSGNVTVTISIQDMNDNAPLFSTKTYFGTIRENATCGTFVDMVKATDADKTERNNKISFAIEAGGFDNFRINSTTGNVTVQVGAHFDRDNINLYNLTIIAIDQGANSFTATATMSVTITDVNNKPPNFNQSSYSISTPENKAVGSFLTSCIATDPDESQWLNYNINNTMGWDENGRDVNQSSTESYVRIYQNNGTLYVNSALDRETVAKLVMIIYVTDDLAEEKKPQIATATVTIMVLDSDDSPPKFTLKRDFRVGMKRNMEPDSEIFELKSYVTDKDTPENGIDKWIFQNVSFEITSELKNKLNGLTTGHRCSDPICVTGNGTIVNNMYYTQEMSGFFNVTVLVKDDAGNDTAYILIFLIADSQVLKMTIYGIRTNVAKMKDEILSDCSNVTGLLFVYDSIADHKADDGTVDTLKTDLFFHIQDHKKNKVLSAEEAKRLLDEYADKLYDARKKYNIVSIESSLKSGTSVDESSKTIYVLAAVVALLTLVVLIVGYMFFSSSSRYKRKLRAAMPPEKEINIKKKDDFITPGSNMYAYKENPLLNTVYAPPVYEEIDATSHNSLDTNDVDDAKLPPRGELEEREVTLDMYGEDYFCVSKPTEDPLEAALREHDAQKQASIHELGDSRVGHSENEADKEQMVTGFVNNGFHHDLELETSEI